MIKPDGVRRWAESMFDDYLRSLIREEPFFPRRKIHIGRVGATAGVTEFRDEVKELWDASKNATGSGYTIVLEEKARRARGLQNEPVAVEFETEADFLSFLDRTTEVTAFLDDVAMILDRFPAAKPAVMRSPGLVVSERGHWRKILLVAEYLRSNPNPRCYVRALPVAVETKFIERHTAAIEFLVSEPPHVGYDPIQPTFATRCGMLEDAPILRGRFLCDSLRSSLSFPCSDISLPVADWAKIVLPPGARVLGCENKTNFLALPPFSETLALFGGGGAAEGHFSKLPWLKDHRFVYWGDLDPSGLNILAGLRSNIPNVRSVLMDEETLLAHVANLAPAKAAPRIIPLQHLRGGEVAAAVALCEAVKGIEQERLLFSECLAIVERELNRDDVFQCAQAIGSQQMSPTLHPHLASRA